MSAFTHVLIGYNDVRRIRAEEVAAEREKLAVLNRIVRHNLRTEVQTLTGYAELLAAEVDPETDAARYATVIRERAGALGEMHDDLKGAFETLEAGAETETPVLGAFLPRFVENMRVTHSPADIRLEALSEEHLAVEASPELPAALAELVANTVERSSTGSRAKPDDSAERSSASRGATSEDAPTVRIGVRESSRGRIDVTVTDDGPGIPEMERSVVSGETAIDQLNHGQGLGLWFVKWVADLSGGSVEFDDGEEGGAVTIRLRRNGSFA